MLAAPEPDPPHEYVVHDSTATLSGPLPLRHPDAGIPGTLSVESTTPTTPGPVAGVTSEKENGPLSLFSLLRKLRLRLPFFVSFH